MFYQVWFLLKSFCNVSKPFDTVKLAKRIKREFFVDVDKNFYPFHEDFIVERTKNMQFWCNSAVSMHLSNWAREPLG